MRKFSAKRVNEHVKSVYAFANTLAAAIIGAAYIIPSVTKGADQVDLDGPGWVLIGLTLHGFGHFVIWRFLRREDWAVSLTVQLALGVGLFMLGSSVFLWRITAAFDRDHARRPGAPTEP